MFSTSRVGRIISFIIFILGSIGILFIPFLDIIFKIILIVVFFLIIQIVTFINLRKCFAKYQVLYNNCELNELIKKLEKKYKENNKSKMKSLYMDYLFMCYCLTHELDKIKPLVNKIENELSNMKDSTNKIEYIINLFNYYLIIKDYDKTMELRDEMKRLLRTVNIDKNRNIKQKYLSSYYSMNYRIALYTDKTDKKILQEAEKLYLERFNNNDVLIIKVFSAIELISIYEKLGNEKKAKEYADYVIKNHKDCYIEPERISKYSK